MSLGYQYTFNVPAVATFITTAPTGNPVVMNSYRRRRVQG